MDWLPTMHPVFSVAETEAWLAGKTPCTVCGLCRTAEGHDPCIANLPGVAHACCGHGTEHGYVHFANGLVLRGKWEHAA